MQRVIVTGGAGFIGSHLVDKLIEQKIEVIVFDDLSTGKIENVNPKAKLIDQVTTYNQATFNKSDFEGVDTIFHLAAIIGVDVVSEYFYIRKCLEKFLTDNQIDLICCLNPHSIVGCVLKNLASDSKVMGFPAINYMDYNKSYIHFKNFPKIMKAIDKLLKKLDV